MNGEARIVRAFVVAEDTFARAGLAALLSELEHIEVVGTALADARLVPDLDVYRPDVLVWDFGSRSEPGDMALMSAALAELAELGLPLVVLLPDQAAVLATWAAGGRALLRRSSSIEQISAAIQAAQQGLVALDPTLADALLPPLRLPDAPLTEALTPREVEVLKLLAEGYSNRAIAHRLNVSEHTVKFHVNAIMGKLNAQSRTEAVVRATRLGLISL